MKLILLIKILILSVLVYSCVDSNEKEKVETIESDAQEVPATSDSIPDKETKEFTQLSSGLEYKVAEYYMTQFQEGLLRSVVDGTSAKMNPKKNNVYLDTKLYANNSLGFFSEKYPEFIDPPKNAVEYQDNVLLTNTTLNIEGFNEMKTRDFLAKDFAAKKGDLHIAIGQAFEFNGAYYVHAWTFSKAENLFHHQCCTFKFDKSLKIDDLSCANVYQSGYSGVETFVINMDRKELLID